jgi:hypothetical protein
LLAGCWWLTPVILATQEAEIRRTKVQSQSQQIVHKTLSQNYPSQKGLVEWLKVKAQSSSPRTSKKKKRFVIKPYHFQIYLEIDSLSNTTLVFTITE